MANTKEPNTDLDFMREAYRQLHSSSRVLLDTFEVSWTEGFLLRQVHTLAGRRLETLDEDLSDEITLESSRRSSLNSDAVRGDHIVIGEISGASSVAIGSGANLSVSRVKNPRYEQY